MSNPEEDVTYYGPLVDSVGLAWLRDYARLVGRLRGDVKITIRQEPGSVVLSITIPMKVT